MMENLDQTTSIFIIISLIFIGIIAIFQLIQFCFWLIIVLKYNNKTNTLNHFYYQELLKETNADCQVEQKKLPCKFFNYNIKTNTLKFKKRDFNEVTPWNVYQTLSSTLIIKWKNNFQTKRHSFLPLINLILILGIINTIICSLLFYLPVWTNSDSNLNQNVLTIFSFAGLLIIIMSWLFWTMTYEKFRKELLEQVTNLDPKTYKIIKMITLFKSLFPMADWLF